MGIKQLSKGISVGKFFAEANWQGLKKAMESEEKLTLTAVADDFIPSLDLTVEDFFSHHNWRGVKQMVASLPAPSAVEEDFNFSLSMTVKHFFEAMKWEGRKNVSPPVVAKVPVMEVKKEISPPKQELNLDDLSDLF